MKILSAYADAAQTLGKSKAARAEASEKSGRGGKSAPAQASGDSVRLSGQGKLIATTFAKAVQSPDVRRMKVTELKEKVDSGEYVVDSKKTAEKLVKEDLRLLI